MFNLKAFVFCGYMTQPWTHDTAVKILHSDTERFYLRKKNSISYVLHFLNNDTTGLISSLHADPIHTKNPTGAQAHTHELFPPHLTSIFFFGSFLHTQLKQTNIFMNVPMVSYLVLILHIKYLILITKLN